MKRILSFVLSVTLLLSLVIPVSASQYNDFLGIDESEYDMDAYYADLWNNYSHSMHGLLWDYVCGENYYVYTQTVKEVGNDAWIEFASRLTDEELTQERYTEILVNLLAMMDYNTSQLIEEQVDADSLKTLADYTVDAAGIIVQGISLNTAFGSKITEPMKKITTALNLTWGGAEFTIDTIQTLEHLDRVLQQYENYHLFLTAIANNATDSKLRAAASELMSVVDKTFFCKVDAATKVSGDLAGYLGKTVFFDTVVMDYMVSDASALGLSDADMSTINLCKSAYAYVGVLPLAVDLGTFAADMLIGISNIMNRYNEMRALVDLRNALIKQMTELRANISDAKELEEIDQLCRLMKNLVYINYRGEYCAHEMLTSDAQAYSLYIKRNGLIPPIDEVFEDAKEYTKVFAEQLSYFVFPMKELYKQSTNNTPEQNPVENLGTSLLGGFLLAEAPYSAHINLFSHKQYSLSGYVQAKKEGNYTSYSMVTKIPTDVGRLFDATEDYAHDGNPYRFTVEPSYFEDTNSNKLSLKFTKKGLEMTIGCSALDMYTDKEFFVYLAQNGNDTYLVIESVEYSNIEIVGINYSYKSDDFKRVIKERIEIINLANFIEYTITAEYDPEDDKYQYNERWCPSEIKNPSLHDYEDSVLYYEYCSENKHGGKFETRNELVEYLDAKLGELGLSGRLYCNSPSLPNITPVFSSKVEGDPKHINFKTDDDLSLTATAWIGVTGDIIIDQGGNSGGDDHKAFLNEMLGTWYSKDGSKVYVLTKSIGPDLGFTSGGVVTTDGECLEINLNTEEWDLCGFDVVDASTIKLYRFDYNSGDGEFEEDQIVLRGGGYTKVSEQLSQQLLGTWKNGDDYIKFDETGYSQSIGGDRKKDNPYYALTSNLLIVFDSGKYKQIRYSVSGDELIYNGVTYSKKG